MNPKRYQAGIVTTIQSGSDAADNVGVTFIDRIPLEGFIFNVTADATFMHTSYLRSSTVRGAACTLLVESLKRALREP